MDLKTLSDTSETQSALNLKVDHAALLEYSYVVDESSFVDLLLRSKYVTEQAKLNVDAMKCIISENGEWNEKWGDKVEQAYYLLDQSLDQINAIHAEQLEVKFPNNESE